MTPFVFELTDKEKHLAYDRLAWRLALRDRFVSHHILPLILLAVGILSAATLGFTKILSPHWAEMILLVTGGMYMLQRIRIRRCFSLSQKTARTWIESLSGTVTLSRDETGFHHIVGEQQHNWRFNDVLNCEETRELVYLWPRVGAPLIFPRRDGGEDYLAIARIHWST